MRRGFRSVRVGLTAVLGAVAVATLTAGPAAAAGYTVTWNLNSYPSAFAYAYQSGNCSGASKTLSNGADHSATSIQSVKSPSYVLTFKKNGSSTTTTIPQGKCQPISGAGVLTGLDPRR